MLDIQNFLEFMNKNLPGVGIAGIGGFIHYIYKVSKGDKFSFTKLVINIVLAGWIGYLCQEMGLSPAFISIAGFCSYPLLNLIENKGPQLIIDFITKK